VVIIRPTRREDAQQRADVSTYLDEAPAERRGCLAAIRELCRQVLAGYDEAMEDGMPSYKRDGVAEVAFTSQKNYLSLYVLKQHVLDSHRDRLRGLDVGKGCIRHSSPAEVDLEVVRSMLEATAASDGATADGT
jgi:uncharacterized protein YdhG (YjbR/CyaY superfamily)